MILDSAAMERRLAAKFRAAHGRSSDIIKLLCVHGSFEVPFQDFVANFRIVYAYDTVSWVTFGDIILIVSMHLGFSKFLLRIDHRHVLARDALQLTVPLKVTIIRLFVNFSIHCWRLFWNFSKCMETTILLRYHT